MQRAERVQRRREARTEHGALVSKKEKLPVRREEEEEEEEEEELEERGEMMFKSERGKAMAVLARAQGKEHADEE
eukprot:2439717-Rhodomonas_salina.1